MRFTVATTALLATLASTVLGDAWKPFGGDLAFVGPDFNATFKAGDVIPVEYVFYTPRPLPTPGGNGTSTNSTRPPTIAMTGTVRSIGWVGLTGNQTIEVALDNNRNSGYSEACRPADNSNICQGNFYPRRVDLQVPSDAYASNYTILFSYALSLTNQTIVYKHQVMIADASSTAKSPAAVYPNAPAVKGQLPSFPKPSSGLVSSQVSKATLGALVAVASAALAMM
ncbi:hypothetical protein BGZ73_004128 [Actinomortierella ambigua]|nr:hypothetical protein BGZ73_004128 [Actinomortierella ambigua]